MKNRVTKYNNGYIGNNDSSFKITNGIINLNKKNTVVSESYNVSTQSLTTNYSPPSAWVSLPSFSGITQGFAGVFAIYNHDSNFVTLQMDTSTGNYTVDWGDGTTGSFADNAIAYKRYTTSTYSGLTSSVYNNYKTLVIQAYPQTGTLNGIVLTNSHNQSGFQSNYRYPWLNIQIVGSSCTNLGIQNLWPLEQVNFLGRNNITTGGILLFNGCRGLRKILNLDTSTFSTFRLMFRDCYSLIECPKIIAKPGVTDFGFMFENCYSLRYVPWFNTSSALDLQNMFANCPNLTTLPEFNFGTVTNALSAFAGCRSLKEIPSFDFSKVINAGSIFQSCNRIKTSPRFTFSSATFVGSVYNDCRNLIEVNSIDTSNSTSLSFSFSSCSSLIKLPETLNINKVTTMSYAFNEASALESLPRFIRDGTTVMSTSNMCYNTGSLKTIPNFNTDRISTWDVAFINNYNLETVGFTFNYPAGQTWATSVVFNSTFNNCQNLKRIEISDVSGISGSTYTTAYSNMFNGCASLSFVGLSGISENFSVQNCSLGSTALNELYSRLAVVGASGAAAKTITVSGNWGAVNDDPNIAIAKGWQVSG